MLLRFRTANVRSLRDEQELSFVAAEDEAGQEGSAPREVRLAGDRTVAVHPLVGIFGANASGKSNVVAALVDMRRAVLNSYGRRAGAHDMGRHCGFRCASRVSRRRSQISLGVG